MSTLNQIESAVASLPVQDQWSLLSWLQGRLAPVPASAPARNGASPWLDEVRRLRESLSTGRSGISTEQMINEIRS